MTNLESILTLSDECVATCAALCQCLALERQSFVEFKMEEMLHNNFEKDRLLGQLTSLKQTLRGHVATLTGGPSDLESLMKILPAAEAESLAEKNAQWRLAWEALAVLCQKNQWLFKHSLRNLDAIADNLKRLFGLHSTYTARGTRVDLKPRGSTVGGSY
jgi:hypothetical protein